jgi:hypothetical protein
MIDPPTVDDKKTCNSCVYHALFSNGSFGCGCMAKERAAHAKRYCSRASKKTQDARDCQKFVWNACEN